MKCLHWTFDDSDYILRDLDSLGRGMEIIE